jgi:hypothetical protein
MNDTSHPDGKMGDSQAEMGFVGVVNSFDTSGSPTYGGDPTEDTTPKTCSNVNCHFGKETPAWDCP